MPGEIATYLLGAQGGIEDDYPRLYAATNPVLLRYLRVTTDADPHELAELAEHAWATVLVQLKVCPADEDTWLELVIGSAREAAAGRLRTVGASPVTGPAPTEPDDVDRAIEVLRACPPDQADVLAMGVIANLGREATSRLTGHEPGAVLALVQQGQERLAMSLEELIDALRGPARPDEVADLRLVTPLFTAALTRPAPGAALAAAPMGKGAAWAEAFEASLAEPSPVEPLGLASLGQAPSSAFHLTAVGSPTGTPSRSAKAGVAATVWLVALGGMGTAAAMSGLLTAAVDGILGDHGKPPLVTAEGPVNPGTPSAGGGSTAGNPQAEPGAGSGTGGQTQPDPSQAAEQPGTGGSVTPASLQRGSTVTQIVLASYVVPDTSTPSTPSTPTGTPPAPTTPTTPAGPQPIVPPPASGPGVTVGNGNTHGADKASTRAAKKAAKAAARAARAAAKADARAANAHPRSATAAKAKAAKSKAAKSKAAKSKAAKSKAAKAKAAKAKAAKAHGHHKGTKA